MSQSKVDYASLSAELESILSRLQEDTLDVDAAIAAYERGMEVVGQLEQYLQQAENKVVKLQKLSERK